MNTISDSIGTDDLFLDLCSELFSAGLAAGRAEPYGHAAAELATLLIWLPDEGMAQRLIRDGIALGRAEVGDE